MRKLLLIASLAVLATPCVALAQDDPNMAPDNDKAPAAADVPNAGDYGKDVAYSGAPDDVMSREAWLDGQIRHQEMSGAISDYDAMHDRQLLASVRRQQDEFQADHGALTPDDRDELNSRLDGLKARMDQQLGEVH